jgi:hypothetical protein
VIPGDCIVESMPSYTCGLTIKLLGTIEQSHNSFLACGTSTGSGIVSFPHVSSCGTADAKGLMFKTFSMGADQVLPW